MTAWLFLALVSYLILADIACRECRRELTEENEMPIEDDDANLMVLVKGTERYIFLYGDDRQAEALRTLGRFASNPDLSFTWYDAAVLSQEMRQRNAEQREAGARKINLRAK